MWFPFLVCSLAILGYHYFKKERKLIQGQNVVIIGGSSGIGKELGIQLANKQNRIILVSRTMADLELIQRQLSDKHIFQVYVFEADWTVRTDLERLRLFCLEKFDSIDKLVLCAGVLSTLLFEDICNLQEFDLIVDNVFRINAIAPIVATQVFLQDLMKQKGQIVVISSAAGVMAAPTRSLYTATKHSVTGFFRALRIELAPKDVSVCIVIPGSVDTNLRNSALDAKYSSQSKKSNGISVEECVGLIIEGIENRECEIFIPKSYRFGASLVNIFPFLIDYLASKKYKV